MVNSTFSSEMMFGSHHERYDQSDQFLLLGSEAGMIHRRGAIRILLA